MILKISASADHDLDRLLKEGVRQFGAQQALKYLLGLHETFEVLRNFPRANRERSELGETIRLQPYQSHLIFYRIEDNTLHIVRIRHGREDWRHDFDDN